MKKKVITGALILVLGVGSLVAYADTASTPNVIPGRPNINFSLEDMEAWFKEKIEYKKEMVKEALEKGYITEEEAKAWEAHFLEMEELHKNNGFMPGDCGGFGMGLGVNKGRGFGFGRGMGMMRGSRK
jgi:hypothetical protein